MKTKTRVKAGGRNWNHNQTLVRDVRKAGVRVKSHVKAGRNVQHNQTLVRD